MNAGVSMPVRHASTFAAIGALLARGIPLDPRLLGSIVLVLLAAINLLGVRAGALTQRVFTTGKIATLTLIIVLGTYLGFTGADAAAATFDEASFPLAVAACWYTYLAWQDVVLLAEELREPRRDLPVVLVGTVALTMLLYLAVHAAVYFGLGGGTAAYGETPAVEVARRVLGGAGAALLTGLTLSSMIGGAAEGMLVRPRLAMALARDGLGPAPLAAIDRRGTPYGALLFHASLALALVATGSFVELLPLMAFAQGFLGIFETASYFAVRRSRPELPTSRFHPWAPLLFIAVNAALCVLAAVDNPWSMVKAFGLLAAISLVYLVARPRKIAAEPARVPPSLEAPVLEAVSAATQPRGDAKR
jgi:APA family basic amino acid/polyamine antiporter